MSSGVNIESLRPKMLTSQNALTISVELSAKQKDITVPVGMSKDEWPRWCGR